MKTCHVFIRLLVSQLVALLTRYSESTRLSSVFLISSVSIYHVSLRYSSSFKFFAFRCFERANDRASSKMTFGISVERKHVSSVLVGRTIAEYTVLFRFAFEMSVSFRTSRCTRKCTTSRCTHTSVVHKALESTLSVSSNVIMAPISIPLCLQQRERNSVVPPLEEISVHVIARVTTGPVSVTCATVLVLYHV